ncbi:hypothetical protein LPW11_02945 [Geomonas sp. RF6]|uniref:hypothetical protein n=1 Tax=Geomonas sp. RF6 TaxID=2897342 RepID=UPI001E3CD5E7|nr:hypothetical protein [Geomonas sp. RF6]UFS71157.1 hypothetical protein LPW11_02945 [Geomonas sp. RF6]
MKIQLRKSTMAAAAIALLAFITAGCATTYVPVSWSYRDKARRLAQSDPKLEILFNHCDPKLSTLRFAGESFSEVMMPSEVKHHLGAYRTDTGLIYRNMQFTPTDQELRDLLVHEVSHHCWFTTFSQKQKAAWQEHLNTNPSPVQTMVRSVYRNPADYDTEDFAFTMEYARPVDIEKLLKLEAITEEEAQVLLKEPTRPMPTWQGKITPVVRAASYAEVEPDI